MPFFFGRNSNNFRKNGYNFGRNNNYRGRNAANFGKYSLNLGKNGNKWGNKKCRAICPACGLNVDKNRQFSYRFRRRVEQGAPQLWW